MSLRNSKSKKPKTDKHFLDNWERNSLLIMQLMKNDEANQKLSLERKKLLSQNLAVNKYTGTKLNNISSLT